LNVRSDADVLARALTLATVVQVGAIMVRLGRVMLPPRGT